MTSEPACAASKRPPGTALQPANVIELSSTKADSPDMKDRSASHTSDVSWEDLAWLLDRLTGLP